MTHVGRSNDCPLLFMSVNSFTMNSLGFLKCFYFVIILELQMHVKIAQRVPLYTSCSFP